MVELLPMARDAHKRAVAERPADAVFKTQETRAQLMKKVLTAASAANDAKTIRLRALRLEKERQDAEGAARAMAASLRAKKKRAGHMGN